MTPWAVQEYTSFISYDDQRSLVAKVKSKLRFEGSVLLFSILIHKPLQYEDSRLLQ